MPIRAKAGNENRAIALDHMSTKVAQNTLAAETRAFGNKSAKLDLQRATAAFARAKETRQPEPVVIAEFVKNKK